MIDRQTNHVTRALDEQRRAKGPQAGEKWPEVPEDLVKHLEQLYPPRCYEPMRETLEEHLQYSGMQYLVSILRAECDLQKAAGDDTDIDEHEDD